MIKPARGDKLKIWIRYDLYNPSGRLSQMLGVMWTLVHWGDLRNQNNIEGAFELTSKISLHTQHRILKTQNNVDALVEQMSEWY